MKKWLMSIALTATGILTSDHTTLENFEYRYEIVAASNEASELLQLYQVKEYLIQTYYTLIDDVETNKIPEVLGQHLSDLALNDSVQVSYENGIIILTIEEGQGIKIRGNFPKSYCDPSELNVRFYFLEWFYRD